MSAGSTLVDHHGDADLFAGHIRDMAAPPWKTAIVIDDVGVMVFARYPSDRIFTGAGKWRLVPRQRGVAGMDGCS